MTNYQLARLILLADGISSRKRLQKTVHLLQAAGCPLNVPDFRIHYYGPYSKYLAGLVDQLVGSDVLVEHCEDKEMGPQYRYRVNDGAVQSLTRFERTANGSLRRQEIEQYSDLLSKFVGTGSRVLELAATVVAFHQAGSSLEDSVSETAKFKKESEESGNMDKSEALARMVLERAHDAA